MFKTDSILGKKNSLNQNVWRDNGTMRQDVSGWYFYMEIRLKYEKNIQLSYSRFSQINMYNQFLD